MVIISFFSDVVPLYNETFDIICLTNVIRDITIYINSQHTNKYNSDILIHNLDLNDALVYPFNDICKYIYLMMKFFFLVHNKYLFFSIIFLFVNEFNSGVFITR